MNDSELTLLLYANKVRLEWTLLKAPKSKHLTEPDYLPKPVLFLKRFFAVEHAEPRQKDSFRKHRDRM